MHYDVTNDVRSAIVRRHQLNGWSRRNKFASIGNANTECVDLTSGGMTDKQSRPFGFAQDDMGLSRIDHFLCEDRNPCQ